MLKFKPATAIVCLASALALSACNRTPAESDIALSSPPASQAEQPAAMAGPPSGGHTAPAEHADVTPVNNALPNPYATERHWGALPDNRPWGGVTAMEIAPDGQHLWIAERCGANSCIGSTVDPIVLMTPEGKPIRSFGANLLSWPHGMDVDDEGNVWVADARSASAAELEDFPEEANKGHAVFKFSPQGELLMTLGTPGTPGLPPQSLNEPNDVLVTPNGNIFIAEAHRAQFVDGDGVGNADAFGRISIFSPDGRFIKSFGEYGYEAGQFRTPHTLAMDSQGRLFVGDRGNRRIQIFTQDGEHLDTWYDYSRVSGLYIDKNDWVYAIDSESQELNNPGWRKGLRIGDAKTGEVKYFIPEHFTNETIGLGGFGTMGEGVAVADDGTVYGGEIGPAHIRGISKFSPVLAPK